MIMVTKKGINRDSELPSKIDRAVFPGLQGGPHNNTTAGIAQTLVESESASFKKYGKQVVTNAKYLAEELKSGGLTIVTGKTECHLIVVDLRPNDLSGNVVAEALEYAGIVVNRNSVPNDPAPPFIPSGIRLGTPGVTTRGMKEKEMKIISNWILSVIDHVKDQKMPSDKEERIMFMKKFRASLPKDKFLAKIASEVKTLNKKFPTP
jgi:glycine hydroxymethyltransferase